MDAKTAHDKARSLIEEANALGGDETVNLIDRPEHKATVRRMEDRLYAILGEKGGMFIPLNQPMGGSMNKRLGPRNGAKAADFPPSLVAPAPLNKSAK